MSGNDGNAAGIHTVFWDWNGTLLDDLEYAIGVRNRVFPEFGLPGIRDLAEYYEQFTFPVRTYYERAGVTEALFEAVAHAWMEEYVRGMGEIPLHPDALSTLGAFREAGIPQVVLSASKLDILTAQLRQQGIEGFFAEVLGLSHIYATSKQAIGEEYLRKCGKDRKGCVLLGDSLHDGEVARELGLGCVLISRGHQSREALLASGFPVCGSLREAAGLVL